MVLHEIVEDQEAAAALEREVGETVEEGALELLVAAAAEDLVLLHYFEELGSSLVQMETSFDCLLGTGLQMRSYFAL